MTWFFIDDGFYDHPKVASIPRGASRKGAVYLWTMAGSWSGRYLKDGLVPLTQVTELAATKTDADWLVAAELWHEHGHACPVCPPVPARHFIYHQWPEYQQTREEVERKKALSRERTRRYRGKGDG